MRLKITTKAVDVDLQVDGTSTRIGVCWVECGQVYENLIKFINKMKLSKQKGREYSKIINQIQSLKANVFRLLQAKPERPKTSRSIKLNTSRTHTITSDPNRSPLRSRLKPAQPTFREENKQNSLHSQSVFSDHMQISSLVQRMNKMEENNQEVKKSTVALEEKLRQQREKRRRLEKKLEPPHQTSIAIQKNIDSEYPSKVLTPAKRSIKRLEEYNRVASKLRDEGDIESFLLGNWDEFTFPSPKFKEKNVQFEIIDLMHELGRKSSEQEKSILKRRLLELVQRLVRE